MSKYKKYFNEMFEENKDLFTEFMVLNQEYKNDRKKHAEAFNAVGKKVLDIVRDKEKRLCMQMDKGNKAQYSANLSEKFMAEVRGYFPYIDFVGAKIS